MEGAEGVGEKRMREGGDGIKEAKVARQSDEETVTFYLHNIQSLSKNGDRLVDQAVSEHQPICLMLSESWIKGNETDPSKPAGKKEDKEALDVLKFLSKAGYPTQYLSCNLEKRAHGLVVAVRKGAEIPKFVVYSLNAAAKELGFTLPDAPDGALQGTHTTGGRVIIMLYTDYLLVLLYWPNNGLKLNSKAFRKGMDEQLIAFAHQCKVKGQPLLVMGDLNVAPTAADVSHPNSYDSDSLPFFSSPGTTTEERARFNRLLNEGDLVDAWRHLHPIPKTLDKSYVTGPHYTWRGKGQMNSKYAMRLDHCLVSSSLLSRIESVEIVGTHADRESFLGSDHCPLVVKLRSSPRDSSSSSSSSSSSFSSSFGAQN